jgi:hypothetical protein
MNSESGRRPVSVEDLLRLKRAERPPAEFWNEFDRSLRAKQLAALVDKQPWWQTWPRAFLVLKRHPLPIGAAAAIAVSLLAVRSYQGESGVVPAGEGVSTEVIASPTSMGGEIAETAIRAESSEVEGSLRIARATFSESQASVLGPEAIEVAAVPVAGVESSPSVTASSTETIAAGVRHLTASFVPNPVQESVVMAGLLGASRVFESQTQPARVAVEPLQQITPPGEVRRARFMTAMVSTTHAVDTSARASERAANRLAEERVYDQPHRFGARGAGVQMKF